MLPCKCSYEGGILDQSPDFNACGCCFLAFQNQLFSTKLKLDFLVEQTDFFKKKLDFESHPECACLNIMKMCTLACNLRQNNVNHLNSHSGILDLFTALLPLFII
jgi:hypothetical protein